MRPQALPDRSILDWPHAPAHRLSTAGTFMVTGGTYQRKHLFGTVERLTYLTNALLTLAGEYHWRLQAWAVFSNHYHFVAGSEQPASLKRFIQYLHSISAKYVNREDNASGRTAWFQYWDTQLTYPKSFLSRLNYVHTNAVRHGLVRIPEQYPWCSAGWFVQRASLAFRETVMHFPSDKINVPDNFDVVRPA